MCSCHSILECCVMFSGVKLSIRLFVLLLLKTKIISFNQTDGITISDFITNLDPHKKVLLLLGALSLHFDDASVVLIKRFVGSAVGKIHKLHTAKLHELEALWLAK